LRFTTTSAGLCHGFARRAKAAWAPRWWGRRSALGTQACGELPAFCGGAVHDQEPGIRRRLREHRPGRLASALTLEDDPAVGDGHRAPHVEETDLAGRRGPIGAVRVDDDLEIVLAVAPPLHLEQTGPSSREARDVAHRDRAR